MPRTAEQKVQARGGAKAYRQVRLANGKPMLVAVVPKAGPKGGHTVALGGPSSVKPKPKRLTKTQLRARMRARRNHA